MSNSTRRELIRTAALAAGAAALTRNANAQANTEPAWPRLFPAGFNNERVKTTGAEINVVTGGEGPPLLMMHGAPQSLCTWHLVAPELSKHYRLVMIDLRGYGDSSKPEDGENHYNHSKIAMALDGVEVMKHFGYDRFAVVGHDRGGRVGRRMALDHPENVTRLTVIDIVPAHYLYTHVDIRFVQAYFHWFSYIRRAPVPENELKAQYEAQAARATGELQKEYMRVMLLPGTIHAMCEDYRASASIDLELDLKDEAAGKKIQCPVQTLWAATGSMGQLYDVLGIWKKEGVNVTGKGLPGGHSLQETTPKETTEEILNFLKA
jgi:haloacetate dehalogenase